MSGPGLEPLPRGWKWMRADEVGDVQLGRQRSPKNRSAKFPTKYLRAANITERGLDLSDVLEMDFRPEERERYALAAGDLVLAEASGSASQVGRPAIWQGEIPLCCFQNTVIRLRPGSTDSRYLLWLFTHFYRNGVFAEVAGGVGINHLSAAKFSQLLLPVAPPHDQQRIVAEIEKQLTRLEAGAAALRRAQANLKRYRAAVLTAACEGRLVPTEAELARREGREYESAAAGQGELPKGWTQVALQDLRPEIRNGVSRRPDAQAGVPILRISAVRPLSLDLDDVRHLSGAPQDYARYALKPGDLLFTRYNGNPALVGAAAVVPAIESLIVYPDKLIRVRVADSAIPKFVAIAANVGTSRRHLESRTRTTAGQSGISGADLKTMPIPLPPFAEQQRIVAEVERRLSVVEELEAAVAANLARAARLRQAILQRAFSGELVPPEPSAG